MLGRRFLLYLVCCLMGTQLSAQFVDDFSDGDFSANPAWTGEVDSFLVNTGFVLQSKGNPAGADQIYLVTPSTIIDSVEWNFWLNLDFNPSSTNYVRVYLVSDQANLEGNLNGYFLQVGEASATTDSIDLYRQDGATLTKLMTGSVPCISGTSGNSMRIRVTRDTLGNWELLADCSGGTTFTSLGTTLDNTHTATSFFGVYCRYSTSSRFDLYSFDDFSVGQIVGDTAAPTLVSATPLSSTQLDVRFNENVSLTTAQNTANYLVNGGIGVPVSAQRDAGDFALVHLTFSTPFTNGNNYVLTVNNVEDEAGNPILNNSTIPFLYFIPAAPGFRDVVINEILADPSPQVGLPNAEFLELHNPSTNIFDLAGWTFSDGGTPVTLGSHLLSPGGYVILCANSDTALYSGFGPVLGLSSLPALNNSGDNLGLRDNNGNLVDSVQYQLSWYQDPVKDDGGWTLELINPEDSCAGGASNWIASIDASGGTPGIQNSVYSTAPDVTPPAILSTALIAGDTIRVCFTEAVTLATLSNAGNYAISGGPQTVASVVPIGPPYTCVDIALSAPLDTGTVYFLTLTNLEDCNGNSQALNDTLIQGASARAYDILINEIFPDPTPVVGLPEAEFVELYNNSTNYISLDGWTFTDGSASVTLPSYTIAPSEYLILVNQVDAGDYAPFGNVLGLGSLPSLNNSGDSLVLLDAGMNIIHSVVYTSAWYQDDSKDDGGWTLELINPNDTCDRLGNWIASNHPDGGTPGMQNSVFDNTPDIIGPVIVSTQVTSANSVEVCFDETMDVTVLSDPNKYSADNGLGNPVSATPLGPDFACVELVFGSNIDTGTVYILRVTSVLDCKGNSSGIVQDTFVLGGNALPGEIVITEIFPDPEPSVLLPNAEFVEVYNRGNSVISLRDWQLGDRTSTQATLPDVNIFPGDYLIITATANADTFSTFGNVIGVSSFPSLNNTSDSLELYDANGTLIDLVYYSDEWYGDPAKEDGGWTLEKIDPDFTCLNSSNWRASNDVSGGTPGRVNSTNGLFSDTESPSVDRAVVLDPTLIRVYFDELMDISTLQNPGDFVIDNGVGSPIAVAPSVSGFAADMLLPAPLDTNQLYCITVSNALDCPGNPLGSNNSTCFGIPVLPDSGDLVINEILFNPYTGGSDYVELYNLSNKIIDLEHLFIGEIFEGTDSIFNYNQVAETPAFLLPQSYICLTKDKDFQVNTYLPLDPDAIFEMSDFPTYDDNEGECVVFTDSFRVLDRLFYLDDWQFANLDDDNGVSLERLSFTEPTQDENNWHSAASNVRYGTPGYENSQSLVPNPNSGEVWLDPPTFSPDQDGTDDVLGIHYRFDIPGANARVTVFDHKGRLVKVVAQNTLLSTEEGFFNWDGTTEQGKRADIGIYVVIFEVSYPATGETEVFKLGAVVAGRIGN